MSQEEKNKTASGNVDAPASPTDADSVNSADNADKAANSGVSGGDTEIWGVSWTWWEGQESSRDESRKQASGSEKELPGAAASDETAAEEDSDEKSMGLLDHLNELRQRLTRSLIAAAVGFSLCWGFVDQLFDVAVHPLLMALPEGAHAQYTTLPEAFFTRMEIAFVAGFFLASPAIFYQIWSFVAPGLYDEEKKYIIPIAFLSALFFIAGGIFCYFIVFPFAFNFFISYSTPEILMTPKISDYLSFVLKLMFAFGLIFEMPIFTLFLARLGILTASMMRRARRYAIVIIFILAAILTPPDVISQLLMACPMLLLYELSIGVAAIFGRKTHKNRAEA